MKPSFYKYDTATALSGNYCKLYAYIKRLTSKSYDSLTEDNNLKG
jgi:hypothetical protein